MFVFKIRLNKTFYFTFEKLILFSISRPLLKNKIKKNMIFQQILQVFPITRYFWQCQKSQFFENLVCRHSSIHFLVRLQIPDLNFEMIEKLRNSKGPDQLSRANPQRDFPGSKTTQQKYFFWFMQHMKEHAIPNKKIFLGKVPQPQK